MSVLSAPLDELIEVADQVTQWLDVNNMIDQAVKAVMEPIFSLAGWTGDAAKNFGEMVKQAIIQEMGVVLTVINAFLAAVRAVIDAIKEIIQMLEALDPFSWF